MKCIETVIYHIISLTTHCTSYYVTKFKRGVFDCENLNGRRVTIQFLTFVGGANLKKN